MSAVVLDFPNLNYNLKFGSSVYVTALSRPLFVGWTAGAEPEIIWELVCYIRLSTEAELKLSGSTKSDVVRAGYIGLTLTIKTTVYSFCIFAILEPNTVKFTVVITIVDSNAFVAVINQFFSAEFRTHLS